MILNLEIPRDKKGNILAEQSDYKPSKAAQDRTLQVLTDFNYGWQLQRKPFAEFNNKSLLNVMNEDQRAFNIFQNPPDSDPDLAWKSSAVRPITRNKVISVAAHITGSVIFPNVEAQNDNDEEDQDSAQVMKTLVEWSLEQSNYAQNFLFSVLAALVDPAVILYTEYAESTRTIKEIGEDGKWTKKEVPDEIFSGFQDQIVPLNELFINDIYENDIQKQGFLIRRRVFDYTVAAAKYGENENFKKHVRPGIQIFFNQNDGLFYKIQDETLRQRMVEEVIYYNRMEDLELIFVNGVLLTDPDQPNPRKDKKYPFAKTGYEPINNGKFFYYKSLVNKMHADQEVIDTLYRMIIDGTYLKLMPPSVVYGSEIVNASVLTPATVTQFSNKDTKLETLNLGNDLSAGYNTLDKVERSLSEGSAQDLANVQGGTGRVTALQIARIEENAKIMLGLFGKMIGFLVKQYGELRISDILQYLTVADINELSSQSESLKYKTFLVSGSSELGASKKRKVMFDNSMPDKEMSLEDLMEQSRGILAEQGGVDSKLEIYKANPKIFRRRKFIMKVSPDQLIPPSDSVRKEMNLEEYDRAIANPLADQEAIFKDLLLASYPATKNDPNKYIRKEMMPMQPEMPEQAKVGQEQEMKSPYKIAE